MTRNTVLSISSLLLGLVLSTSSCKKDVDPLTPDTGITGSPAFVGPRWQMSEFLIHPSVDFDGDGKVDHDLLPFMPACDRDNTMMFERTGKIVLSEGAIRCDGDEQSPTGEPDTWTYDKATKTIKITNHDQGNSISTWEVLESSSKVLKIKTSVTEDGQTFNATLNWKAI